jgi:sigma-B regulation protein RsbU (phosphoserine phosphatase)
MVLVFVYDVTRIELSKIELEKKQKQIDIDLEKAGEVQKNLLPKNIPDIRSVRAEWFFEPCLTVGGDIFNIYREDDFHVSAYMLDVCGHGVSGAMIAVTVKQFLDQLHVQGLEQGAPFSPEKILNLLEDEFPFERFDCYFTIAYVLLNVKTGHASYGCAGHVPPLIIGPNDKFEVLDQHGTIIGLGQDPPLSQYDAQLKPGDKIILYTDGLTDYFGEKGAAENKDHFYNALMKRTAQPADQIVEGVMAEQKAFRANRQIDDDISLLVIEYTGA